ncbi:hypothetical protein [Georgenia sp. SUBG003]|uniref:hypothetical protein n=1 Tax=Georgenia sp. SUBG003 TaxID=1497974 RepID=UPI003AB500A7
MPRAPCPHAQVAGAARRQVRTEGEGAENSQNESAARARRSPRTSLTQSAKTSTSGSISVMVATAMAAPSVRFLLPDRSIVTPATDIRTERLTFER